jgi:phage regulator Rha-like protein
MIRGFRSADFLGSSKSERLAKCRQMAQEASELAASASTAKQRESYLELVRQWNRLAEELAQGDERPDIAKRRGTAEESR